MHTQDFEPPGSDDYRNVTEFNLTWLEACSELPRPQRSRLASAPFLLFSLRERELDWWHAALDDAPQSDWLQPGDLAPESLRPMQCAALSFLWHLAWRNPYAVRLISGASTEWCDLLKQVPLVTLVERVGGRGDLCEGRLESSTMSSLTSEWTSMKPALRRSSHLVVLHSLLTGTGKAPDRRLPAAACRMPRPLHRVADQSKE